MPAMSKDVKNRLLILGGWAIFLFLLVTIVMFQFLVTREESSSPLTVDKGLEFDVVESFVAVFTAYNTVPSQTDESFCIAANRADICDRTDVVACPRKYPFGTLIRVNKKVYVCVDRMKNDNPARFDISFDKDLKGARQFGIQKLMVEVVTIKN